MGCAVRSVLAFERRSSMYGRSVLTSNHGANTLTQRDVPIALRSREDDLMMA